MPGLLRPMFRKEPGQLLDSRRCEATNPRLEGLTLDSRRRDPTNRYPSGLTKCPTDQAGSPTPATATVLKGACLTPRLRLCDGLDLFLLVLWYLRAIACLFIGPHDMMRTRPCEATDQHPDGPANFRSVA